MANKSEIAGAWLKRLPRLVAIAKKQVRQPQSWFADKIEEICY
jgi:hypothetical protein